MVKEFIVNGKTTPNLHTQNVSRRFLVIFLPITFLIGIALLFIYRVDLKTARLMLDTDEAHTVKLHKKTIAGDFGSVISDLMFLSKNDEIEKLLDTSSARARRALEEDLLLFSFKKGIYDQIRFIDETGMEVVRVNYNGGPPRVVDRDKLQSKADRYYFKETMKLGSADVYVSPFDLNVEHGKVEEPIKPITRFATPLFGKDGRRRGILIFNYLGEKLINPLMRASASSPSKVMLLNADGYWLYGPTPEDEWGFMYKEKADRTFGSAYPEAWATISKDESGQFSTEKGMFTYTTIYPILPSGDALSGVSEVVSSGGEHTRARQYYWKVVSHVPPGFVGVGSRSLLARLLLIFGVSVSFIGAGSWFISSAASRRGIAELALRESETRHRLIKDTSFDGIVISDADGRITDSNPMAGTIFGYGPGEMVGLGIVSLMPAGYRERHLAGIRRFLDADERRMQGKAMEVEGLRKDGTIFPIELAISSFTIKGAVHFSATMRDITERRSAEEVQRRAHEALETRVEERTSELRAAYDRLKSEIAERKSMEEELLKARKLESLGVLAGGIAHDFNNLLTGILGNISHARILSKVGEKPHKMLGEAEKASLRARDLTQQLLTFSRGGEPVKRTASVVDLIKDSAGFAVRGSNVRCEYIIPDDLWAVDIDAGQISQVINNLVINADHSMPDGGAVTIRCENVTLGDAELPGLRQGEYVLVSVADHGSGIKEEDIQRIFDPYFTTKEKGSGLGLATSYAIVKNHDGLITVASKLGLGTTFDIYLPATHADVSSDTHVEEEHKVILRDLKTGAQAVRGEGRVLVMDDEDIIRELVREILTGLGYDVDVAVDGTEAIALYKKSLESDRRYSVVIMDLTVPGGMGGSEAIKALLEIDPGVKAIVSSGYSNDPIMADYAKHGFAAVISKPYKAVELGVLVHNVIDGTV